MKKTSLIAAAAAASAFMSLAGAASATNLLSNGNFATGDFTDWTLGGNTGYTGVTNSFDGVTGGPNGSTYFVYAGAIGSDTDLSQTFSDVAGDTYTVSGWVYGFGGTPSDFGMQIDGNTEVYVNPYPASGWTEYSFTFTGTGSDTLNILNRNDPSYQLLDNFSVTSVPEPASWAMMMFGVGLIGLGLRRRSAAASLA
jgi:hypothetical protein